MATLTLTVLRSPDSVPAERRQAQGGALTIGRSAECDWPLADPLKSLSRKHCTLQYLSGAWQAMDLSVNGTFVNFATTPIGRDMVQPLRDGDRLRLGDYEIEVRIEEAARAVDDTLGMSLAPPPFGASASPFGEAPAPFGEASPFGESPSPFGAPAPSAAPLRPSAHRLHSVARRRPSAAMHPAPSAKRRARALLPRACRAWTIR